MSIDTNYACIIPTVENETPVYVPSYQPVEETQPVDPVFAPDVVSIGEVESPYTTYAPPVAHSEAPVENQGASGVFDIGSFYKIPEDKVVDSIREIRYHINKADLTEKTDIEKYEFIEGKFSDTFGQDFMMARNLSLPSSMFYMIGIEFNDTLHRILERPYEVNRERLYGDKSTGDIQSTIRDKYSKDLTNKDLFLMVNEMRSVGVLDTDALRSIGAQGANNVIDTLTLMRSYAKLSTQNSDDEIDKLTLEERDRRWIEMLNNPINRNNIFRLFNAWAKDGRFTIGMDVGNFIMNFLSGVRGSNGLFELLEKKVLSGQTGPVYIHLSGSGVGIEGISFSTGAVGNVNKVEEEDDDLDDEDWDKMLRMMLKGMDDYDNLIRERMEYINSVEYTGAEGGGVEGGTGGGAEGGTGAGSGTGAEGGGVEGGTGGGTGAEGGGVEGGTGAGEGSPVEDSSGAGESSSGAGESSGAGGDSGGDASPEAA